MGRARHCKVYRMAGFFSSCSFGLGFFCQTYVVGGYALFLVPGGWLEFRVEGYKISLAIHAQASASAKA